MASGRDREIAKALETHLKAEPWNTEIEFCVAMDLQV